MKKKLSLSIATVILGAVVSMCLFGCVKNDKFDYFDTTIPVFYGENDAVFRVGDNNNGVDKFGAEMDRLTSAVPSERQLQFLELEYYNFIHFGMNTFSGNEWGDGKESPALFNPKQLNTDAWCETLRASGSKGVILTAKHHDGFCLWQTNLTDHSIKNSPYKNGQGDVVAELAESCKKYGLKFGLYLSPWDRNAKSYGHKEYNDFFIQQLTELCTRYGDLFCMWFDGARGEGVTMDEGFDYDWSRIYAKVRELQPNCVMNVMGPDVRWVGNEAGVARDSEWCVYGGGLNPDKVADLSQKNPGMAGALQNLSYNSEDIGSRDILAAYDSVSFYPAEADVSMRRGWFYHWNQSSKPLEQLLKIYYKTAGANCSLLLNVTVDKGGEIPKNDTQILKQFGEKIKADRANPISYTATVGNLTDGLRHDAGLSAIYSEATDSFEFQPKDTVLDLKLAKKQKVSMISLREDLRHSERIEKYDIYAKVDNGWMLLSHSTNVGNRRSTLIAPAHQIETDTIRIVVRQSRKTPVLRSVQIF